MENIFFLLLKLKTFLGEMACLYDVNTIERLQEGVWGGETGNDMQRRSRRC